MRTEAGLIINRVGRIADLVIDRPERRNAMSRALMDDIILSLDRFDDDDDVWLIRFRGSGDVSFSAGADLKERAEFGGASLPRGGPMSGLRRNVFEAVLEFRKPTIACINGYAVGGGLELAMACDVRIAVETAQMGLPEAQRGLGANFGSQMLPRLVPLGIAYEMLYTARLIDAHEAARWGLVNDVVPLADLDASADDLATAILANAPLSVRRYKSVVSRGRDLPIAAALRLEGGSDPYRSSDRDEGVAAFLEGRDPHWQGR